MRDWEQGRSELDQLARAHLTVIAHDPEGVCKFTYKLRDVRMG